MSQPSPNRAFSRPISGSDLAAMRRNAQQRQEGHAAAGQSPQKVAEQVTGAPLPPQYVVTQLPVDIPRNWMITRGIECPEMQPLRGNLTMYSFVLDNGLKLSLCRYFFCLRTAVNSEIVHLQVLNPIESAAVDAMMEGDTQQQQQQQPQQPYAVNMQGYVVGNKSVSETALRDQLMASAATMKRLMENANAGRRQSEAAIAIHHAIKTSFAELPNYQYDVGQPSHRWINGVAGLEPKHLMSVIYEAQTIMQKEPTLLRIDPPVYVIGDLHGNFKDFAFFAKRFGLWDSAEFVPARFLFLGDYVDRGYHSVETIAFVLALKVRYPDKVFLLRGNHECSEINGDEELYMSGSFKTQLKITYGVRDGEELWRAFNRCFDYMPLAAVLDNKIFCVHAGIPRYVSRDPTCDILQSIASIQRPPMITDDLVFDLIWADPATQAEERFCGKDGFPPGFGRNSRGPATCVFGKEAVRLFCENSGCSHLIRAHQSPMAGVDIAKNAAILTVFSSSHYCGGYNRAASVLVHDHKLDIILSNPEKGETDIFGANDDYRMF